MSDFMEEEREAFIQELQAQQTELEAQYHELKLSREETEKALEKYYNLYDFAPIGLFTLDRYSNILEVNLKGAQILGEVKADLIDRRLQIFISEEYMTVFNNFLKRVFSSAIKEYCEVRLFGKKNYILIEGIADNSFDKKLCRVAIRDITARKEAEKEQLLTLKILEELNISNEKLPVLKTIAKLIKEFTTVDSIAIRLREGKDYPYFITDGFPSDFKNKELTPCSGTFTGEIIRDESSLSDDECFYRCVLTGTYDSSLSFFTEKGTFWTGNMSLLSCSSSEWKMNNHSRNICAVEGYETVVLIPLRSHKEISGILQFHDRRANLFKLQNIKFFERIGEIIGMAIGKWKSEEEKEKITFQLYQSQKLEALGTLTGGISHDLNNILAVIMGYAEIGLMEENPELEELISGLSQIFSATERARDLVKQILTFSRPADSVRKPLQISIILKECINFFRATLPSTIEIRHDILCGKAMVMADGTQIYQLVMNLITNAAYAMKDRCGILTIELSEVEINNKCDLPECGTYVKLSVSDTGRGIKSDIIDRIFEPFFTTKPQGEGTGLGLSTVYGIVKNHGGTVRVKSEPDKGSTFDVLLPVIKNTVPEERNFTDTVTSSSATVLFIDDEEHILSTYEKMMKKSGYSVTSVKSPLKALEIFLENSSSFDIVITDQTMPDMTGTELIKEFFSVRPDIPVILVTGYNDFITCEEIRDMGFRGFLKKPFHFQELNNIIMGILDR